MTLQLRADDDLRHVYLERADAHHICHLCCKPRAHADHVPIWPGPYEVDLSELLGALIDEARSAG